MTTPMLAAMLIAGLAGQANLNDLVGEIQQKGYQRVAVCPRPIILRGNDRTSIDDITLLAAEQIHQITQELVNQSQGVFKVIDPDIALSAIRGMTLDDLNDPEIRQGIAQQAGAESMLFVFAEENLETSQWDLYWKLIELGDSSIAAQGTETLDIGLSDAAYMGESFEVRRWGANGLEIVGFDSELPRDWAMGVGSGWERLQYASLQQLRSNYEADGRTFPHPLENMQLSYGIELVVNGQPISPERICDKLYVAIDPSSGPPGQGPDIGIRMFNQCGRPVFVAIYIDGLNMLNQVRELPFMTPTRRHWYVPDGYDHILEHWYHTAPGSLSAKERFQLVEAPQAVVNRRDFPPGSEKLPAFGDRIDDRIGMITCLVYTYTWEGVDANFTPPKTMGLKGSFGFGAGKRERAELDWVSGQRGILLAAMTLHYRTPAELEQIRAMGCEAQVAKAAGPSGAAPASN